MNHQVLNQYNLVMRSTGEMFDGYVEGPISGFLYSYSMHPDAIQEFADDLNLALNGQLSSIDPLRGTGVWYCLIDSQNVNLSIISGNQATNTLIIPIPDFIEILLSWKECVEG